MHFCNEIQMTNLTNQALCVWCQNLFKKFFCDFIICTFILIYFILSCTRVVLLNTELSIMFYTYEMQQMK